MQKASAYGNHVTFGFEFINQMTSSGKSTGLPTLRNGPETMEEWRRAFEAGLWKPHKVGGFTPKRKALAVEGELQRQAQLRAEPHKRRHLHCIAGNGGVCGDKSYGITGCTEFLPAFFKRCPNVRFDLNQELWKVVVEGDSCWLELE